MENFKNIPVSFEWEGKTYTAVLEYAVGYGCPHWDLMKNRFYKGQLNYNKSGWQFSTQKYGYDERLAKHFGKIVEATGWKP